jgi:uncharacterized membrane protein YcaP (DUF421 family)
VDYAVLETDGTLNVILCSSQQPLTAQQANAQPVDYGYPIKLIDDGTVLHDNLQKSGRDLPWLMKQLAEQGVSDPKDVFLLSVTDQGNVYFTAKDDAS